MKTDPAGTTILEECYWQTPGIVRRFAEGQPCRPPANILPHKPGRMMTRSAADTESETTRLIHSRIRLTEGRRCPTGTSPVTGQAAHNSQMDRNPAPYALPYAPIGVRL